jgi:hypothetical protein
MFDMITLETLSFFKLFDFINYDIVRFYLLRFIVGLEEKQELVYHLFSFLIRSLMIVVHVAIILLQKNR